MNDKSSQVIDAIAGKCIAGRLRLVNRVITNLYDNAFRPLGVKASQFNILVVAGKLGWPVLPRSVRSFGLDTSTLSRNVERIGHRDGWKSFRDEDAPRSRFV